MNIRHLVLPYGITELCQHWLGWWLVAYLVPSQWLNQCWLIVNWMLRKKLHWNLNPNQINFIQENAFENGVCFSLDSCVIIIKSLRVTGGHWFWSGSNAAMPSLGMAWLLWLPGKTLEAISFKLHMIYLCASENVLVAILVTWGQGHAATQVLKCLSRPHYGVGWAVRFLAVGTIGQEERPPQGQLWMEQCLTSLKYWPI